MSPAVLHAIGDTSLFIHARILHLCSPLNCHAAALLVAYLCNSAPMVGHQPLAWVWGAVQVILGALAGAERDSAKKTAEWTKIEEAILFKWLTPTLAYFESMV